MEELKISENGVEIKIEYTEKYADGIFISMDNEHVKQNCKILNIELGDNTNPNEMKQKVTKIGNTGILTIRILNEHFQYIVHDYAEKEDVVNLIRETLPESKEPLATAYNLSKINTLEDFDF